MPSRRTVAMFFAALCLAVPASGASEAGGGGPIAAPAQPVHYQAPVSGPIVDPFRPPATPYGARNRGVDSLTPPGEPLRAAGPGTVTFAGQVGGTLVVVVLHADALRTSYVGLSGIEVKPGDIVASGQPVARATDRLHFGVRAGTAYLDPMALLDRGPPVVRLVPDR